MDLLDFMADDAEPKYKHRPWMDEFEFILGTRENLAGLIDLCIKGHQTPFGRKFALDLETTGLDNRVDSKGKTIDEIVGVCLAPDPDTGIYIPLRHMVDTLEGPTPHPANIPWRMFVQEFRRLMDTMNKDPDLGAIFHNAEFDQEFLEFNPDGVPLGDWNSIANWEDTLPLTNLNNSRELTKGLKAQSKALDYDQMELSELYEEGYKGKKDFSLLDPTDKGVLFYGGGDGIFTLRLFLNKAPLVLRPDKFGHQQKSIYAIEKSCTLGTRWMMRNRILTDHSKALVLAQQGQEEWVKAVKEVYADAETILGRDTMPGRMRVLIEDFTPLDPHFLLDEQIEMSKVKGPLRYPEPKKETVRGKDDKERQARYDITAPAQLGEMFDEMAIPGLVRTEKSGQIKTSKDVLDEVILRAESSFPFMSKVKRFREVHKALSTYLFPIIRDAEDDGSIRISFKAHRVDTGRFATPSGGSKKETTKGWPRLNLQSIPNGYDEKRPECMTRLRECIIARVGFYIVAIDYAGVELRLATNLSGEPKWLAEYFRCSSCARTFDRGDGQNTPLPPPPRCPNCGSDKIGDLHTLTAMEVYGSDAVNRSDWKKLRGNGKQTNFSLSYGGGGFAVMRAIKCSKQEGYRIKRTFDKSYPTLQKWWIGQHNFARKREYVLTPFGRKYPVPDIKDKDGYFRSKAERNSINGPIQGASADVTKVSMALIYKECRKRGWLDKVRMIITMHDELVFEIHESLLEEAIYVLRDIMVNNGFVVGMNWPVPLTADVEIGRSWAVEWDLNEMLYGEVRFIGDVKWKEKAWKEAKDSDTLPAGAGVWEDMARFPACLSPFFSRQNGNDPIHLKVPSGRFWQGAEVTNEVPEPSETPSNPGQGGNPEPKPAPIQEPPPEQTEPRTSKPASELDLIEIDLDDDLPLPPAVQSRVEVPSRTSAVKTNGEFEFQLAAPLTTLTAVKLARVIHECGSKGTQFLKILSRKGEIITGWETLLRNEIRVNGSEFHILARHQGL